MRSKTWAGFSSCLNRLRNFTPWLSPLFELTKTNKGLVQDGGHVAFQKPGCEKGKGREKMRTPRSHMGQAESARGNPPGPPADRYARAQKAGGTDRRTATQPPPTQKEARPRPIWLHVYEESKTPCAPCSILPSCPKSGGADVLRDTCHLLPLHQKVLTFIGCHLDEWQQAWGPMLISICGEAETSW